MIFQQPQWHWTKAYEPVEYGFVHNDVRVEVRGKEHSVFVTVPIEFFQLLDTVLTDSEKAVATNDGIQFYLDRAENRWIFGFETVGGDVYYDLWYYTPAASRRGRTWQ